MTNLSRPYILNETAPTCPLPSQYPPGSLRFDLLVNLLSAWIVAGLFLDGWYHNTVQNKVESFVTPWHALLYSGLLATGIVLTFTYVRNVEHGYNWRRALPRGYIAALVGFVVFGLSGIADFAWHSLFGFEFNVEALLSPPHLALAASMVPLLIAPFRAAWSRPAAEEKSGWRGRLPALLSLLFVVSVFTFFTQFANAFTHANVLAGQSLTAGDTYYRDVTGLASILIPTGIEMAFILLAIRRWVLPVGSLTLVLTANAALMYFLGIHFSGQHWPVLLAAFGGGVLADVLLFVSKPSPQRVGALRVFAFVTPFVTYLLYFLALNLAGGVVWRIHMWLGVAFLAGVVGLGLSVLLAPPAIPEQ